MIDLTTLDLRLAVTDSPVGGEPEKITCSQHTGDNAASLAVYPDHLHCYGCGFHLLTLSGLAFLLYGRHDRNTMARAAKVAHKYTAASLDAYRERVTQNACTDPLPRGMATAYHALLTSARSQRQQWFYDRGLTWHTVDTYLLGHDSTRFTIPIFDEDGRLLTIRFRRDDFYGTTYFDPNRGEEVTTPKYSGMRGRNGLYLFPAYDIASSWMDYLVVVEGELDAIRLWQEGIPAVSTTNGAGNVHRVPQMIRDKFPSITRLFFATDQDTPGRKAAEEGMAQARRLGFQATMLSWFEDWGKDITELMLNGHTLAEAAYDGDETQLPIYRD